MSLPVLPYDLLFHIAQYLDIDDIHSLQVTCKSLRSFTLTRPVYRSLAHALLCRSRPLPLPAFRRLADISTENLITAVDRAHTFEKAWRVRAPRPAKSSPLLATPGSFPSTGQLQDRWYIKISAPPNEEIDWLSPITASYTLCATKSGRVVCWDVARDVCLAEWDPRSLVTQLRRMRGPSTNTNHHESIGGNVNATNEKKWELWKCRVEFDERAVYFTMARVLKGSYDDNRVMEFVLMKLAFPPEVPERTSPFSSPSSNPSALTDSSHLSQPKSPVISPPSSLTFTPNNSKYLTTTPTSSSTTTPHSSPMSSSTALPVEFDGAGYQEQLTISQSNRASPDASPRSLPHNGMHVAATIHASEPPSHSEDCIREVTTIAKPTFLPLTSFYTTGVVMNVFLLDPPRRLLSAFVWLASSNTIGLYVLLDWDKDEYIYVDTGVGCLISSNWSCILHDNQIVIHSEEADAAYQHFYPLNALRSYSRPRNGTLKLSSQLRSTNEAVGHNDGSVGEEPQPQVQQQDSVFIRHHHLPSISARLPPVRSVSKKFVFPRVGVSSGVERDAPSSTPTTLETLSVLDMQQAAGPSSSAGSPSGGSNVESSGTSVNEDAGMRVTEISREGNSKGKGKERAVEDDDADVSPSRPSLDLPYSKGKGRMREIIDSNAQEQDGLYHDGVENLSGLPASSSSSASASAMQLPATVVAQQSTSLVPILQPPEPEPAPNPYPFPPWYPESAHFVRQWWPTLPGVPRLSCTVVLLATHDPETHRTRFVLAQHYFKVPITRSIDTDKPNLGSCAEEDDEDEAEEMLHLWYVATPFEVVCVLDSPADNGEEDTGDRPRPLVAVDFGHAVWVEYTAEPGGVYGVDASRLVGNAAPFTDSEEEDGVEGSTEEGSSDLFEGMGDGPVSQGVQTTTELQTGDGTIFDRRRHRVPKCLRFVTFPPVHAASDGRRGKGRASNRRGRTREEAIVRTLEIPEELDLDGVETINIDQSQGAVILSVKEGKIFILRYE